MPASINKPFCGSSKRIVDLSFPSSKTTSNEPLTAIKNCWQVLCACAPLDSAEEISYK